MSEKPTPDDVRQAVFRGERSMLGDAYARVGADRTLQICVTFRGFIVPLEWSDYLTFVREAVRHQGPVTALEAPDDR